jgi:hypothetical protein
MHETVSNLTGPAIAGQHPMPLGERVASIEQCGSKIGGRVVVVVEVNLDLAEPGVAQRREYLDQICPVVLHGVEERVPRRSSVAVAKATK